MSNNSLKEKFKSIGLAPYGAYPNQRQMGWYKREAAAFFHYGVNTFTNMEWGDGTEDPKIFNPTAQNCRQWVYGIKKAGFTAAIITAKHHDGFCLWPSAYTEHSIKNSPYKNGGGDIVREFTDACREYDIKAGIYLSPWDRNCEFWGTEEYNDYYVNQLTELLTNYGEIHECWWDGAGSTEAVYDWGRWAFTVRNLQPNCVMFGSLGATEFVECRWVGNERGIAGKPCWGTINPDALVVEDTARLSRGEINGSRFIPAETNTSIRPGWFYHADQNDEVLTPENLVKFWFESSGRNSSILLNIPPSTEGLLHETDVLNLQKAAAILKTAFSVNLLQNAAVTAPNGRTSGCGAEMLLLEDPLLFYASTDEQPAPVVEFDLDEPKTLNCIILSEVIELGHRVRGFEIEAFVNGNWQVLCKGECIGYRFAEHFNTVTTSKLRLKITKADAPAVLSFFGAYRLAENAYGGTTKASGKNLAALSSANVSYAANECTVAFGGIYPFNTVEFCGKGINKYTIQAFNGLSYNTVYEGSNPSEHQVCHFNNVEGAYQMKLVTDLDDIDGLEISVYTKA